jgi:hypothetical protein
MRRVLRARYGVASHIGASANRQNGYLNSANARSDEFVRADLLLALNLPVISGLAYTATLCASTYPPYNM